MEKKEISEIDFYNFIPESDDVLIPKSANSAFKEHHVENSLKDNKRKLLLTCGFNLNACVKSTVIDARERGFNVCLLRDLTGNGNDDDSSDKATHLEEIEQEGVMVKQSREVLEHFRAQKNVVAPTLH